MAYDKLFIAGLEWIWGKGFMSPGGQAEVAEILRNVDVSGKTVLDIGCGIGGIDRLLVAEFGAKRVVGIDVELELVQRAIEDTRKAGLIDQIEYIVVKEGPLKFKDDCFDVVFSKDAIIHIDDKLAFFVEVLRVLKPGGSFVGSDWLAGAGYQKSQAVREWLDVIGLEFNFSTPPELAAQLNKSGFEVVELRDRNAWYQQAVRDEIEQVTGENREKFIAIVGEERADHRFQSSNAKRQVVDEGCLRPTHFFAEKPNDDS